MITTMKEARMKKRSTALALLLALAASTAYAHGDGKAKKAFNAAEAEQKTFGIAGNPAKATRTVKLVMSDKMRFTPDRIAVKQGETIRFVVANKGKMLHEMVIGTPDELKAHAELMKKFTDMEHDEPHMAHVSAGKSQDLVWTFNRPGEFDFACLVPGHYEAGMTGKITVSKR
jgi:uncharacterized cupredoxin-like copper-binding protein